MKDGEDLAGRQADWSEAVSDWWDASPLDRRREAAITIAGLVAATLVLWLGMFG